MHKFQKWPPRLALSPGHLVHVRHELKSEKIYDPNPGIPMLGRSKPWNGWLYFMSGIRDL